MKKAVFGLAANEAQADRVVNRLLSSGFTNEDISILYPDKAGRTKTRWRDTQESEFVATKTVEPTSSEYETPTEKNVYSKPENAQYRATPAEKNVYPEQPKGNKKSGSLTTEAASKAPEGATTGAVIGGILGGSLGLLAGIGALAIPGLGPFIAAGPLMAALGGSGLGGSVGLLVGALSGYGIREYEVKQYEAGLKQGNILLSVHAESDDQIHRAEDIMKKENIQNISSTSETTKSWL